MADISAQRRLAAILAADVVGYSRLMGEDETGTLTALKQHRTAVIDPTIAAHRGRIVKLMGDGVLVEFASVVDAVNCAVGIQRRMVEQNADTPDSKQITLRIGVNLGDIIIDDDDIYGDGVNIAARLEGLATPNGVCISDVVHQSVLGKLDLDFMDMGEQTVKHITKPVHAYYINLGREPALPSGPNSEPLPLPDKPSIAVLPFDNMSGDPEQDYFADGLAEDLITDLSKISGLFVVARNSSSVYKGQPVDIRSIADKLGVKFVLEGSVRKSGQRVRINAQLINAASGGHLWADRYDGSLDEVFALQDEVCAKVVSALSVQLIGNEADNLKTIHTNNLEAYELFVRARATPYPPVPERIESARKMFMQVVELDPDFAGGYAGVSSMMSFGAIWRHDDTSDMIEQALEAAYKAISVDEAFGWSYTALGMALMHRGQYAEAIAAAREAITRQPNDADAHGYLGFILGVDGQCAAGIDAVNQAIRLNPLFFNGPYLNLRGQSQVLAEDYRAAIDTFSENIERNGPIGPPALCWGAAAYEALGLKEEAGRLTARLAEEFPRFTMTNWNYLSLIRDDDMRQRITRLMKDAGVSDL
ncbi:MAG: tetratricopeptide repeat protein [Rhodospirillales bacterium]|nr:tetratricopeptide repeat protein [Rhodospirillales bacterium]